MTAPQSETEAVFQYRPFVLKTAHRFSRFGVPLEDLVQEGLMAVAIAFRTWRADGGANFLTWIHRPVYYAMRGVAREHGRQGGSLRGGKAGTVRIVSLEVEELESGPQLPLDFLPLHEKVGSFEGPPDPFLSGRLPGLVSQLERKERQVLRLRYEKGLTYSESGQQMKISRERVRQIEKGALARLKAMVTRGERAES